MQKFKVTFFPDNKTIEVEKDRTILSAALSCGIYINSACGGDGVCARCKVILKKGQVLTQPHGLLSQEELKLHVYLACLTSVQSDLEIEIPPQSRINTGKSSVLNSCQVLLPPVDDSFSYSPLTRKMYLELPKPSLNDPVSDLERIYRQVSKVESTRISSTGLASIWQLGRLLRDSEWKVTLTLGRKDDTIANINIESADTSKRNFGFAFDIGTTTISGQLIDLISRNALGNKSSYNRQASFGSDVITRIIHAKDDVGLMKLQTACIDTMNQIIQELIREHNIDPNDVTAIVCAGNTTMVHLMLKIDPAYIRQEPYIPTVNLPPVVRAAEIGVNISPHGLLYCVPGVSSYIGGDTTAGILASRMYREESLNILIDIGTNGEIALGNRDFLIACAASAGPAFEGSGVSCGMRAGIGAIQKISIQPGSFKVTSGTIGNAAPLGICGSGYIELLDAMLTVGIIDKNGKITDNNHPRIRHTEFGKEFVVVFKEDAQALSNIVITEADIENLKRSKAAIYSAAAILVRHMQLSFSSIAKIYIAGGFGSSLNIESAIRIGLLPDIDKSRFVFIGNSALCGASRMLLSYEALKAAEEIARKITNFELSTDNKYMEEYMAALFFPHTDLSLFPSFAKQTPNT